jgi:DNA-binding SARP family transcriptional activator/predicted ATPase
MSLKFFLLGQFKLESEQGSIELPSRPAQSLLAYLGMNAGIAHRRETLASLLWGESTEQNARGYLRQALWRMRKAFESGSLCWEDFLFTNEINVTFKAESDYWLDVKQLLQTAEGGSLERLIEDIELYRGEFLPGFYDEWVISERERILSAYYQKMNRLLEGLVQGQRWDEVLKWGEHWIRHGFAPEPAYRALLQAYAGLGNAGMVSLTYQRCVEALERELGVGPAPETADLYEQLRRGEHRATEPPVSSVSQRAKRPAFFDEGEARVAENLLVVAREGELEKLENHLRRMMDAQGNVVFITGEAGSGKTTLIDEFTRRAQKVHPELVVVGGKCNYHTGIGDPYLPFREILGLLTGDVEARWTAGAITKEHAQYLWSLIPITTRALLSAGADLVGTFIPGEELLERARDFSTEEIDWSEQLQKLIYREKTDLLSRNLHQNDLYIQYSKVMQWIATRRPLVLVIDDLQWADLGSIGLLMHLSRYLTGSRILIIGAYRPEEVALGRSGERHPLEPVIHELHRLFGEIEINVDQVEGCAFVDALLDSEPNQLGEHFREMLYRLTRGNPLFTIELLRGMQERGDLVQKGKDGWVEGPALDWERLPARVEAVIAERIGRLDAGLQAELRIASVEGEVFTAEVVARVQACAEGEVLNHLSQELDKKHHLIHAQSIQRLDGQLISQYRFQHILVQKYLYNSLDEVERVHLHEQVGSVLESLYGQSMGTGILSVQLARHFQEAKITEKAITYLRQSGERALHISAYQEAINHLNSGLDLLATLPDPHKYIDQELSLQLAISMAWHLSQGFTAPGLEGAAMRALELSQEVGNTTQLCQALSGLVIVHYVRADYAIGYDLAKRVLDLGQQVGDALLIALGHWCMGIVLFAQGKFKEARYHLDEIEAFYDPRQHHRALVLLRGVDVGLSGQAYLACCLWVLGYPEQALKHSQAALDLAHEFNHSFTLVDVLRYGGCEFHLMRQDAQMLKGYAEELIDLAQKKDLMAWLCIGKYCKGIALVLSGQLEEGILLTREGMESAILAGSKCFIFGPLFYLADTYAKQGNAEHGLDTLTRAFELMEETGGRHYEAELYRLKGVLQVAMGDPVAAGRSLLKAIEVARQQEAKMWELRAVMDLYRLWRSQGREAEATRMLSELYDWFGEGFSTPDLLEAKQLLETSDTRLVF